MELGKNAQAIIRKGAAALGTSVCFEQKPRAFLDPKAKAACGFTDLQHGVVATVRSAAAPQAVAAALTIIPSTLAPVSRLQADPEFGMRLPLDGAEQTSSRARIIQADWQIIMDSRFFQREPPAQGDLTYVDCFLQTQTANRPLGVACSPDTKTYAYQMPAQPISAPEGEVRTRIWYDRDSRNNRLYPKDIVLSLNGGLTLVGHFDSLGMPIQGQVVERRVEKIYPRPVLGGEKYGPPIGTSATIDPEAIAILWKECCQIGARLKAWLQNASQGRTSPGVDVCQEPQGEPIKAENKRRELGRQERERLRQARIEIRKQACQVEEKFNHALGRQKEKETAVRALVNVLQMLAPRGLPMSSPRLRRAPAIALRLAPETLRLDNPEPTPLHKTQDEWLRWFRQTRPSRELHQHQRLERDDFKRLQNTREQEKRLQQRRNARPRNGKLIEGPRHHPYPGIIPVRDHQLRCVLRNAITEAYETVDRYVEAADSAQEIE